jgi:hypothetical protein
VARRDAFRQDESHDQKDRRADAHIVRQMRALNRGDKGTTTTAVAHPCDEISLRGALEAAEARMIAPILVGPKEKIRTVAASADLAVRDFAQPSGGAEGGRDRSRLQSRAADEGQPTFPTRFLRR